MMADGEMGVEVTWALSRHGFLTAIAGVTLHDMACGRRREKRDDGEGKGGRMEGRWWVNGGKMVGEWRGEDGRTEGRWKMTEEVTECN